MTIQVTSLINETITLTSVVGAPITLKPYGTVRLDMQILNSELTSLDLLKRIQAEVDSGVENLTGDDVVQIRDFLSAPGNPLQALFDNAAAILALVGASLGGSSTYFVGDYAVAGYVV